MVSRSHVLPTADFLIDLQGAAVLTLSRLVVSTSIGEDPQLVVAPSHARPVANFLLDLQGATVLSLSRLVVSATTSKVPNPVDENCLLFGSDLCPSKRFPTKLLFETPLSPSVKLVADFLCLLNSFFVVPRFHMVKTRF